MTTDDDQDDVGEVLAGQDDPPTSRRVKMAAWVVVALAVIGALVGVVIHNHSLTAALPSPSTSAPSSPVVRPSVVDIGPLPPISPCDEISSDGLSCSVSSEVPAAVLQAIRGMFPDAELTVNTIIGSRSNRLFERTIHADTSRQSVDIRIVATDQRYPSIITTDAKTGRIVGIQIASGGYQISISISGTSSKRLSPDALTALVKDHRLLVLR